MNICLQIEVEINPNTIDSNHFVPETIFALIDYIEITSNGKVLQQLTGDWLYVWHLLYKHEKRHVINSGYISLINKTNKCNGDITKDTHTLHFDIPFWFSSDPSLSIPIWAVQHEQIAVNIKLRSFNCISNNLSIDSFIIKDIQLLTEFAFVDESEKNRFDKIPLEYLIEQVEFCGEQNINVPTNTLSRKKISLTKDYFVNEIIWFVRSKSTENSQQYFFNFWMDHILHNSHIKSSSILLNGKAINPRFPSSYYTKIQRYQYHSGTNTFDHNLDNNVSIDENCVYIYSFSLNPNKVISSGFLSTDKFNTIELDLQINGSDLLRTIHIYTKKYNILRINNGYINILSN